MSNYTYLVLEGFGVTAYTGDLDEIQIHTVDERDLEPFFNQTQTVFPGNLRHSVAPLASIRPKVGQKVRVFNYQTREYSRPLRIDAVFTTPHIGETIQPEIFIKFMADGTLDNLCDVTSLGEFNYYTDIATALLIGAIENNSFIVDYETTMRGAGFATKDQFNRWLGDFFGAGLIVEEGQDSLRICDSLIYLFMHAINRRQIMNGPVFVF